MSRQISGVETDMNAQPQIDVLPLRCLRRGCVATGRLERHNYQVDLHLGHTYGGRPLDGWLFVAGPPVTSLGICPAHQRITLPPFDVRVTHDDRRGLIFSMRRETVSYGQVEIGVPIGELTLMNSRTLQIAQGSNESVELLDARRRLAALFHFDG